MTADQLGRVLDYLITYGWEPRVNGWARTRGNSVSSAIQHSLVPDMPTYLSVRNAIADYVNGDDGWLAAADTSFALEKAADLILWEEGQTVETVLDALQGMVLMAEAAVPAEPPVDWEEVWYD